MKFVTLLLLACFPLLAFVERDLYTAVKSGNLKKVNQLIQEGAMGSYEDSSGKNSLMLAIENGETEISLVLIENGRGVNGVDYAGNTPLHYTAKTGSREIAEALIQKHTVNPETLNKSGESALDVATTYGHISIADYFRQKGFHAKKSTQPYFANTLYGLYLIISVLMTVWVARTLHKNGRIFLVYAFKGDEKLSDSVNHLLVVGFYLINIGYITLALKASHKPENWTETVESLSTKVGLALIVLGVMHFFNLFMFGRLRKKTKESNLAKEEGKVVIHA